MDTGTGKLVPISDAKAEELISKGVSGIFQIGEILEIRKSRFRVQSLNNKKIVLKLLKNNQTE
jgi:hypothetical protein